MQTKTTLTDVINATNRAKLRQFINPAQIEVMWQSCQGEEGEWFRKTFLDLAGIITNMPETYDQEGKGDQARIYLHYFTGGCDWYITEKDFNATDPDDESGLIGHYQAFGVANLGYGPELGYISIPELLAAGAELDLHWTVQPIADVAKARAA
jgi:hypothetical protein